MKKRACFLSLLVASFLAIFVLASCKKPVGGGVVHLVNLI